MLLKRDSKQFLVDMYLLLVLWLCYRSFLFILFVSSLWLDDILCCFACIHFSLVFVYIFLVFKLWIPWSSITPIIPCFKLKLFKLKEILTNLYFYSLPPMFCFSCHILHLHVYSLPVFCTYRCFHIFLSFNLHTDLFKWLIHILTIYLPLLVWFTLSYSFLLLFNFNIFVLIKWEDILTCLLG